MSNTFNGTIAPANTIDMTLQTWHSINVVDNGQRHFCRDRDCAPEEWPSCSGMSAGPWVRMQLRVGSMEGCQNAKAKHGEESNRHFRRNSKQNICFSIALQ